MVHSKCFRLVRMIFVSLMSMSFSLAQYQPLSPYLADPALSIGYVDSCAQFWMQTYDASRGGYFTNIDRQGNVITSWGTNKNLLTQTRNAYGFARAYMLTGNEAYKTHAQQALDFMYSHAWDDVHGGWYSQMDINGNIIGANDARSAFHAHYALLGPAAAFEAFGDSLDLEMLLVGYDHLESAFWDDRPDVSGYYDHTSANGLSAFDKSFNATVDAITTHLLSLYLQTHDGIYLEKMEAISQQIIDHLVASMPQQAIGFVEEFDSDWNWDNGQTMTIMGHVLKSAWCMARVYQIDPQQVYLDAAETLIQDVLDLGYDHDFGGPYKDYNRSTGSMLMWGNPDTAKAWWQMEQGITAGYSMYAITGDVSYLEVADETLHFFMRHFVDHTYGDVYENRTRYGEETWGLNKGGGGKAAYHSIETGYYNYLYASTFVHQTPFELYYWFAPADQERVIQLTPLESTFIPLSITAVERDGEAYTNFDMSSRELTLPANVGGQFRVTFQPGDPAHVIPVQLPRQTQLFPAYPNPFNATVNFTMDLGEPRSTHVSILDLQGKQKVVMNTDDMNSGRHQFSWNGTDDTGQPLPSGVYLIQVKTPSNMAVQKITLLK